MSSMYTFTMSYSEYPKGFFLFKKVKVATASGPPQKKIYILISVASNQIPVLELIL